MAEGFSIESAQTRYRQHGHSAFVLGYSGGIGRGLVKALNEAKLYKRVVLIGRHQVNLGPEIGSEFEQKVVDFENLQDFSDVFDGLDVGFSCLGTSSRKDGDRGFVRVDHDYVLNAAEIAKSKGCKHFNIVSSIQANKHSSFLYTQIKGQVEAALEVMHFERLSIFRPGGVIMEREEPRVVEKLGFFFLKPVTFFFPTAITVPLPVLTSAMLNNVIATSNKKEEVFENKDIHRLGSAES